MAKTKSELLEEAKALNLDVTEKNTVAEITAAINEATDKVNNATETIEAEEHFAKAGKRSEKAVKAAEAEAERQARKEAGDTTPQGDAVANIEKGPAPKTRPLAERKGKAYKKVAKLVDKTKTYSLAEALELATQTATTKFDSTVEIHVRLGVDPKQADQNIRTTVTLPNGTGKNIRVAAIVADADVEAPEAFREMGHHGLEAVVAGARALGPQAHPAARQIHLVADDEDSITLAHDLWYDLA